MESLPRLPIFLAELTGYHPTVQTIVAQIALASVYILGAIWVFVIKRERKTSQNPQETSAPSELKEQTQDRVL